jgi:hypothetical protein
MEIGTSTLSVSMQINPSPELNFEMSEDELRDTTRYDFGKLTTSVATP